MKTFLDFVMEVGIEKSVLIILALGFYCLWIGMFVVLALIEIFGLKKVRRRVKYEDY